MRAERRHTLLLVIVFSALIVAYALYWFHENPMVNGGGFEKENLGEKVLAINAPALPTGGGEWKLISAFRTSCVNGTVRVCIGVKFFGKKNVGGTEVRISAPTVVSVKPNSPSVEISGATLKVVTFNNTLFGDMVPEDFAGIAVFKALEGPFTVEAKWCGDPNHVGCMVVVPEKPAWGRRLTFDAWPDFTIGGKPPTYSGNATFVVTVEYKVRTGFFTAEKRKIILSLPVEIRVEGGGELT